MYKDCDWCGQFFNWVFPDPFMILFNKKDTRLFFCSEKCYSKLKKKMAQQKLKKRGIIN